MNSSLIKIGKSEISNQIKETVNARELHQFIESKQDFSDWIKNRIKKYGFIENDDFSIILGKRSDDFSINLSKTLGRPAKEYHITLDMAKELSMIENNEKGRQIRKYFIECEKIVFTKKSETKKQIEKLKENIKILE